MKILKTQTENYLVTFGLVLILSFSMSGPSASSDASKEVTDEQYEVAFKNAIAVEGITKQLAEVTSLAEELDHALRSAQQDTAISSTVNIPIVVTPSFSGNGLGNGDALSTSTEVCKMFRSMIGIANRFRKLISYIAAKK